MTDHQGDQPAILNGGDHTIDVVIIGGGINGAGLFRDLCEQGVSCLITDKKDFGSGTSSAPSRLIHGGLKYLETGEFGLVAQSTLERNLLLKNAPHFVTPLPTLIPIFSWTKGVGAAIRTLIGSKTAPRSRGALLIKIGLALYDYYGSHDRVMPRHRLLSRKQALAETPGLTPAIVAGGTYYDAAVSQPERLVYELVADGLAANPQSASANYAEIVAAAGGGISFQREDGARFSVRPKLVVNAAGPWIDHVNGQLGAPTKMIGGTKGSHILLKHDALLKSLGGRMIYFEADDGRICLVYGYLGRVMVGSTDIPADNPDTVQCTDAEIDYLLDSVRVLMPGFDFNRDQITYAYSGIRPLPASNAAIPGLISRDHSAPVMEGDESRPFPIISLVGGKWTTFRGFAEEVADSVLARLGQTRNKTTRSLPIGGGHGFPTTEPARRDWVQRVARVSGKTENAIETLLSRYGTVGEKIALYHRSMNESRQLPDSGYDYAEIEFILRHEQVTHLSDIVMRRTTLAIAGDLTIRDLEEIAHLAASVLGWTMSRMRCEVDLVIDELTRRNLMTLPHPKTLAASFEKK